MIRFAVLFLAIGLGGCGIPAAAWVGLAGAGLGYAASANNLIGTVIQHEDQKKP